MSPFTTAIPVLAAALFLAAPAQAQLSGGVGGGGVGGGGIGSTGTGSSPAGTGISSGSGIGSGPGTLGTGDAGIGSSPGSLSSEGLGTDLGNDSTGALTGGVGGAGNESTQERASEGSTTINPLNVDSIARGGDLNGATGFGSGADTAVGTSGALGAPVAGAGPARLYDIPRAAVGVDLPQIRRALAAGPSATPKPDGR